MDPALRSSRRATWTSMWRYAASRRRRRRRRTVVNRHIVPALGGLPLAAVDRTHVTDLHHGLSETPAMANMAVATLSHMYTLADGWGMAPEGTNPCRSVVKYPERRREAVPDGCGV